jgi:hypothetical protein
MLYTFKSKATGNLVMLQAQGQQVLRLIGKADADQLVRGILEPADMPAAIAALQLAVQQDDATRAEAAAQAQIAPAADNPTPADTPAHSISLRQRVHPLLQMLQKCHAANTPMVWGV